MKLSPRALIGKLKRLGLYTGRLERNKITKYQKTVVARYGDVAKGEATAVKVPSIFARAYRAMGARVRHGRVLVAAEPGSKLRVNRKGKIVRTTKEGTFIVNPVTRPKDGDYYLVTGKTRYHIGDLGEVEQFLSKYENKWSTPIWENIEVVDEKVTTKRKWLRKSGS